MTETALAAQIVVQTSAIDRLRAELADAKTRIANLQRIVDRQQYDIEALRSAANRSAKANANAAFKPNGGFHV